MKKRGFLNWLRWAGLTGWLLVPHSALACAACYGQSDSPLAQGMNWGIFCLLGVVAGVLIGFAAFFIYHLHRAARLARDAPPAELPAAAK